MIGNINLTVCNFVISQLTNFVSMHVPSCSNAGIAIDALHTFRISSV